MMISTSVMISPASSATFEALAQINGITDSQLILPASFKANSIAKISWKFSNQYGEGLRLLEGKNVADKYTSKNYDIKNLESAWVVRTVNLICYSPENSAIGKTQSYSRVNFLESFPTISSSQILAKWKVNEEDSQLEFTVHPKCAEIRVFSEISLNLQAEVLSNGVLTSRYIWLDYVKKDFSKLAQIKGTATIDKKASLAAPKKSIPSKKPTTTAKAAPKKSSCSVFQGEKIYATYGMAEPPFGVTTIKFENITDCRLDLSIRGDFIGSSNNNQMRCSVSGIWSLEAYSRVEFAPAGTVQGAVSFQTAFPQLSNCFRTINAQKNFVSVIVGATE
jgi:hypothetical protein